MKILNLYAGIGGNRKLWGNEHEITAVEIDPKIAEIYKHNFPNDTVIIEDAHSYLLNHYKEFDFIWSSPPCPSHSVTNYFLNGQNIIRYPDMRLYQEIIFLQTWFKGVWVVENVKSYYTPLIKPKELGRHFLWANFEISSCNFKHDIGTMNRGAGEIAQKVANVTNGDKRYGFDLSGVKIDNKRVILRNLVNPKLALHVFNCAFKIKQKPLNAQFKALNTLKPS